MKPCIYADHAATTKLNMHAFEAMKPYLLEQYGNPSQPYSLGRRAHQALEEARAAIAACIGADPDEVVFTGGGTESDNWAIKGSALAMPSPGTILTTRTEHHAVLASCRELEALGWAVTALPPDGDGTLSLDTLEAALSPAVRLVSVMTANNELGTIQPISALCEVAHRQGTVFHTDAVAAVGHIPVDVTAWGVDLLSASAHKFGGPKGVGFLYIRKGTPLSPYLVGGAQEAGRRAGTEQVAGAVGMAVALRERCVSMAVDAGHLKGLEAQILAVLHQAGVDFRLNGGDYRIPGLLNLSFRNEDGERLLHRLDLQGIYVSTGAACDSRRTRISPVLEAIGLEEIYSRGTIRLSLGPDNTAEEAVCIAEALVGLLTE
ncbi:MAG: cysteine desulfurase [Clostridia bacterium]|nr:cysteine desulfurase [Clostridia bacterium]